MLRILSTNWPQSFGVNPSVETVSIATLVVEWFCFQTKLQNLSQNILPNGDSELFKWQYENNHGRKKSKAAQSPTVHDWKSCIRWKYDIDDFFQKIFPRLAGLDTVRLSP